MALAFITFMKFGSAVYYVLALARPDCDFVYLIGTQIRCPTNTCLHTFGGSSPFASWCAGFSKKKFSEKMVLQTTGDDSRGRGGAVSIKKKNLDETTKKRIQVEGEKSPARTLSSGLQRMLVERQSSSS